MDRLGVEGGLNPGVRSSRWGGSEATTLPKVSIATHSEVEAHDTATRKSLPATSATFQPLGGPVGVVDVRALPTLSTATQSDFDGQETCIDPLGSTFFTIHFGFLSPDSST